MMNLGRPSQLLRVKQYPSVATAAAPIAQSGTLTQDVESAKFPKGNVGILELLVGYDGLLNQAGAADGTVVTDGHLLFLRALTIESDKQGAIFNKIDGLSLHILEQFECGTRPDHLALASNADNTPFRALFTCRFALPFGWVRPLDTMFDALKHNVSLTAVFGNYTDLLTGANAANNIDTLKLDVAARILPGPLKDKATADVELPGWSRYLTIRKEAISTTDAKYEIPLTYGDRMFRRVILSQRRMDTGVALNNTVITDEDLVSVQVNGFDWIKDMPWKLLQRMNKAKYALETVPTGCACVFDYGEYKSVKDALNLIDKDNGAIKIIVGVNNVTQGGIYVIQDGFKNLDGDAVRAVAAA